MKSVKLLVVGDMNVGKTSLLISYTTNKFPINYIPTIFDNYVTNEVVDGVTVQLSLWDTAGQEEYAQFRRIAYLDTDVFLLCFSVVSPLSFESIWWKWNPDISHSCPMIPKLLVGTKNDLRATVKDNISYDQALRLTKSIGAINYRECSALTQSGLHEVFVTAIRSVLVITPKIEKRRCILF